MVADDERRRVAEMLRKYDGPSLMVLMSVLGVGGDRVLDRLADLIEPSCDRDALLALADEMEVTGREYRHMVNENFVTSDLIDDAPEDFVEYASRIREACGEAGR